MGNPYVKPATPPGYNANPPQDDNSQVPENQLEWKKHVDKLGDPLYTHTTGEADNTEFAFARRLLNGTIQTTVSYTAQIADRGKVIVGTQDNISITLPDATDPQITDGFEFAVYSFITGTDDLPDPTKAIKIEGTGGQTVNGFPDWPLKSGEFALCTSSGGNWIALASYYIVPEAPPAAFTEYGESAPQPWAINSAGSVDVSLFTPALSGAPTEWGLYLLCEGAQYNYLVGDKIMPMDTSTPSQDGITCFVRGTAVHWAIGNSFNIIDANGSTVSALNSTNFKIVLTAKR